jgi:hypothetical protein
MPAEKQRTGDVAFGLIVPTDCAPWIIISQKKQVFLFHYAISFYHIIRFLQLDFIWENQQISYFEVTWCCQNFEEMMEMSNKKKEK